MGVHAPAIGPWSRYSDVDEITCHIRCLLQSDIHSLPCQVMADCPEPSADPVYLF